MAAAEPKWQSRVLMNTLPALASGCSVGILLTSLAQIIAWRMTVKISLLLHLIGCFTPGLLFSFCHFPQAVGFLFKDWPPSDYAESLSPFLDTFSRKDSAHIGPLTE